MLTHLKQSLSCHLSPHCVTAGHGWNHRVTSAVLMLQIYPLLSALLSPHLGPMTANASKPPQGRVCRSCRWHSTTGPTKCWLSSMFVGYAVRCSIKAVPNITQRSTLRCFDATNSQWTNETNNDCRIYLVSLPAWSPFHGWVHQRSSSDGRGPSSGWAGSGRHEPSRSAT